MKNFFIAGLMLFALSAHAQERALIGRCSFDPRMLDLTRGDFRAGNALANFYAAKDADGNEKIVVVEGISKASGFISETTDIVDGKRIDQGESWKTYEVALSNSGVPFQASWIDDESRAANRQNPELSIIGYDYSKLNEVRSVPADGSFLQNRVVGIPNAYPYCIFWRIPQK